MEQQQEYETTPITEDGIESKRTRADGFTRIQLAEWNVPWPILGSPQKGWKELMLRYRTSSS